MSKTFNEASTSLDIVAHNREAWDNEAAAKERWSQPVSSETIAAARRGEWEIALTPNRAVPRSWFGVLTGKKVLVLGGGGGQQSSVLASTGAKVTLLDNSSQQLALDRMVADRDRLELETVLGDMADLSPFADGSFDLIVQPVSNCFVPNVRPVWAEAFRVLKPGGRMLSGFLNPVYYLFDRERDDEGVLEVRYSLPYADTTSLSEAAWRKKLKDGATLEFGHTLEDLIGGQTSAGFVVSGFFEDTWDDEATCLNQYTPVYIVTKSEKLA